MLFTEFIESTDKHLLQSVVLFKLATSIQSAGVAPKVNLRIKHTIHPGFETQGRRHHKSTTGYQWSHEIDLYPPEIYLKKQLASESVSVLTASFVLQGAV